MSALQEVGCDHATLHAEPLEGRGTFCIRPCPTCGKMHKWLDTKWAPAKGQVSPGASAEEVFTEVCRQIMCSTVPIPRKTLDKKRGKFSKVGATELSIVRKTAPALRADTIKCTGCGATFRPKGDAAVCLGCVLRKPK